MALFSIIIPCYNQAHFLKDCIDSIQEQQYSNWEAIVVNDGSPDNTNEVVKQLNKEDSRIRLVEKINGGLSSARNTGINAAVGNYFIFLDADDLIINDCLVEYEKIINDGQELIQSDYLCFIENRNDVLFRRTNIPKYDDFLKSILHANVGPVNGFVVSKNIITKVGYFDEKLTSCEDWDFWIRCAKLGFKPFVVNKTLAAYRFVPGSMGKNALRMLEQGIRVINFHHISSDSTRINLEELKKNIDYCNASIEYLMFTTGIALFNKQYDHLEIIKQDYFENLTVDISFVACSKISNYQTYRNFNLLQYSLFYLRSFRMYKEFFCYLSNKNLISHSNNTFFKKIFPTPINKILSRLRQKLTN
ncbi:MAG: glycosyltransferase [Flavobacterium sp.]|nr:glycosyltransferase [Flavobacterium sp.]